MQYRATLCMYSMPDRPLPFPLPVVPPRFTPQTAAAQNRKLAQQLYAQFFSWPIERSRKILETTPPDVWEREGLSRSGVSEASM
ncbi:MAG: hypothetical protein G01um101438_667 [Parcubacteria group bacterium Gr01-1014_38]|nr:MAG: hypothetical protein G01um101438_667 [Parcubacteria group bacterium Gr01-1014_38]